MDNVLPPAEELVLVDRELVQLDARRAWLLARRAWLLGVLQPPAAVAPPFAPWSPLQPAGGRDAGGPAAQHVLLALGAALLAIAALAFTVVSWGSMGIGGRSAVLAVVTGAALAAPAVLLRRGLAATAEALAGLGLALTVLDAYALYAVGLSGTDPTAYAAGAAAALAAGWAGYARLPGGLRLPGPAALLAAQLPLPLAAVAAGAPAAGIAWALLGTAVLDAVVVLRAGAVLRWFAGVSGGMTGSGALLVALAESWAGVPRSGPALLAESLLLVAGAGALVAARRLPVAAAGGPAAGTALVAGLALVAGAGGALRPSDPAWAVAVYLLCAGPLVAVVRSGAEREPVRRGLLGAAGTVAGLAVLLVLPAAWQVLAAPVGLLDEAWAAGSAPRRSLGWPGGVVPLVLLAVAAGAGVVGRVVRLPWLVTVAAVSGWLGLMVLPVAVGLPGAGVLLVQTVAVAAVLQAARAVPFPVVPELCGVLGAVSVSLAALEGPSATFAVLGALAVAAGVAGAAGRPAPAVLAVGCVTGLLVASGRLAELPWHMCAVLVLLVPVGAAVRPPRVCRVPAEAAAGAAGVLAVALAAGEPAWLALVLGLAGVVCAGAAVRPERRVLAWPAAALLVAAAWVRLAAWEVTVPEAYSLPVTAGALVVGVLRLRRDPQTSSWAAYGPGLAATLLPSLIAAWGDAHWLRPLLLGAAALALTLAGARLRLQAPLLLGGTTLLLVALHELAPYVVQAAGLLPRWLPPALAGLALLLVGATYEKRLHDVRRAREAFTRLR
ncbi:hypothetical protein LG634_11000 [Streptomyces bambusae]|uniref:SCO7613 C-terminal domain-containing membrane protein n=1 Tax=Streptomyces bambusae TaxID=1550616 RepID=UPI001CFECA9A|nr:hypothetical protein [Streptomyces bambusae]MCB5165356.1 hypothetical protein [Streptomyces bambusae]